MTRGCLRRWFTQAESDCRLSVVSVVSVRRALDLQTKVHLDLTFYHCFGLMQSSGKNRAV